MGGEEGTSNSDGRECLKRKVINGFQVGISLDSGDQSSVGSQGIQTYKRRKSARSSSEVKGVENATASTETVSRLADQKHWRNVILEHLYQSLGDDEGGIQGCIRKALVYHPEINHTEVQRSDTHNRDRPKGAQQEILNGTHHSDKSHLGVGSGGLVNSSSHGIVTDMCQRAFLDIVVSEKFTSLCKILFENFQGIKVDGFLDLSMINSRMKDGVYESSPMLFCTDMQQIWSKLQDVGAEIISLAKSLSDLSQTSYKEKMGGSVNCTYDEEKHEHFTREPDPVVKPEQTEQCGAHEVCTCRCCGKKADEKDCLVCDACEDMYHVSCIEPAVSEIPLKSWYCASCTGKGIGSPHEDCVVCERLNPPMSQINQVSPTNEESSSNFKEKSNCCADDQSEQTRIPSSCRICKSAIVSGQRLRICEHQYCHYKYYHERCLTEKQLKNYGSRWLCTSCLCRSCLTDKDDTQIILCDSCDHAYHLYCLKPPRTDVPSGTWFCTKCDAMIQEVQRVKKAYEMKQKSKMKEKCEEDACRVKRPYERKQKKKWNEKGEDVSDAGRGGVEMLLNAANTLNLQEAAGMMKS